MRRTRRVLAGLDAWYGRSRLVHQYTSRRARPFDAACLPALRSACFRLTQRRVEHVPHQRRLARARDTGYTDERSADRDVDLLRLCSSARDLSGRRCGARRIERLLSLTCCVPLVIASQRTVRPAASQRGRITISPRARPGPAMCEDAVAASRRAGCSTTTSDLPSRAACADVVTRPMSRGWQADRRLGPHE